MSSSWTLEAASLECRLASSTFPARNACRQYLWHPLTSSAISSTSSSGENRFHEGRPKLMASTGLAYQRNALEQVVVPDRGSHDLSRSAPRGALMSMAM